MGIGSLKKGASPGSVASAASPKADDFINGAKVDGKGAKPTQVRQKKWKQVTLSLSEEIDQEINRMSLLPVGVRVSRSDVVREALKLLAELGDVQVAQRLKDAKELE